MHVRWLLIRVLARLLSPQHTATPRFVPTTCRSTQATSYCVVPAGCDVAGTSCSSPTAAGIFALLNDLRLKLGKSTLGFINPLIYANTVRAPMH